MGVLALGVAPADAPVNDRRAPALDHAQPGSAGPRDDRSRPGASVQRRHPSAAHRAAPRVSSTPTPRRGPSPTGHDGAVSYDDAPPSGAEPTRPLPFPPPAGAAPQLGAADQPAAAVRLVAAAAVPGRRRRRSPVTSPPRGRVPGWLWPVVCVLALVLGVVGGLVGGAVYEGVRDAAGTVSGGPRRRRHRLRPAAGPRERLDRGGGAEDAAEHGADHRGVRRQGGRRDRLRVRARPAGSRHHQQPRGRRRRLRRRPDRGRRPGRQPVRGHDRRTQPGLRPRGALRPEGPGAGAGRARLVPPARGRGGRRRDRLAARPELDRDRRHRQRAAPPGHHGRRRATTRRTSTPSRPTPRSTPATPAARWSTCAPRSSA